MIRRLALGTALCFASSPAPAEELSLERQIRLVMGTSLEIAIPLADSASTRSAVAAAFEEAQRLEGLLSHYRSESPLSRINARERDDVRTDPELVAYLRRAQHDARRTEGVFDVTVSPLLALHRSGNATPEAIQKTLLEIGATKMRFLAADRVELAPGMRLDPGGDGKGVALDAMIGVLREHGIERAFVNFGSSSIYGLGAPPADPGDEKSRGWSVVVRDAAQEELGTIFLRDRALSVSSSLPAPEDPGETPAAHIVDPRSGELVTAPRLTIAVSPSATDAEVLSTALIVEGAPGLEWLERFDDAEVAIYESGRWVAASPGMAEIFVR